MTSTIDADITHAIDVMVSINRAFESDPLLDEFDIVPVTSPSPLFHDLEQHKLGLPSTSVGPLMKLSMFKLIQFNRGRYDHEISLFMDRDVANDLINITRCVLLVSGDNPIAFNRRKDLIVNNFLDCLTEIKFLNVLFTKHAKSPSAWEHRRFCLLRKYGLTLPPAVILSELEICQKLAEKHPKNYYAWTHRLFLIENVPLDVLKQEMSFSSKWLESHVSDHSASNHWFQVTLHILHYVHDFPNTVLSFGPLQHESYFSCFDSSATVVLLAKSFDDNTRLILSRPGSESLWDHRRSLMLLALSALRTILSTRDSSSSNVDAVVLSCLKTISSIGDVVGSASTTVASFESFPSDGDLSHLLDVLFLIQFESNFVLTCVKETSAWNYEKQVLHSLKYLLYFIVKVKQALTASGITEKARVVCGKYLDSCVTTLASALKTKQGNFQPLLIALSRN